MKSSCRLQVKPKLWKHLQTSAEMQYLLIFPYLEACCPFNQTARKKSWWKRKKKKKVGTKVRGWNEMTCSQETTLMTLNERLKQVYIIKENLSGFWGQALHLWCEGCCIWLLFFLNPIHNASTQLHNLLKTRCIVWALAWSMRRRSKVRAASANAEATVGAENGAHLFFSFHLCPPL